MRCLQIPTSDAFIWVKPSDCDIVSSDVQSMKDAVRGVRIATNAPRPSTSPGRVSLRQ